MSDFQKCPTCEEHDFLSTHKCKPTFRCYHEEYTDEDGELIHADCPEDAAEKFVTDLNDDYSYVGQKITVEVDTEDGRKKYSVEIEPSIEYYVSEIEQ